MESFLHTQAVIVIFFHSPSFIKSAIPFIDRINKVEFLLKPLYIWPFIYIQSYDMKNVWQKRKRKKWTCPSFNLGRYTLKIPKAGVELHPWHCYGILLQTTINLSRSKDNKFIPLLFFFIFDFRVSVWTMWLSYFFFLYIYFYFFPVFRLLLSIRNKKETRRYMSNKILKESLPVVFYLLCRM